jgi:hypothetical protein
VIIIASAAQNTDPNPVQAQTCRLDAPPFLLQALVPFVVAQGQRRHLDRLLSAYQSQLVEARPQRFRLILKTGQGCSTNAPCILRILICQNSPIILVLSVIPFCASRSITASTGLTSQLF